jgi:hypothetical protein
VVVVDGSNGAAKGGGRAKIVNLYGSGSQRTR